VFRPWFSWGLGVTRSAHWSLVSLLRGVYPRELSEHSCMTWPLHTSAPTRDSCTSWREFASESIGRLYLRFGTAREGHIVSGTGTIGSSSTMRQAATYDVGFSVSHNAAAPEPLQQAACRRRGRRLRRHVLAVFQPGGDCWLKLLDFNCSRLVRVAFFDHERNIRFDRGLGHRVAG